MNPKTMQEIIGILSVVQLAPKDRAAIHGILGVCQLFGVKLPGWLSQVLLIVAGSEAS